MPAVPLKPVDRVEILSVMDNSNGTGWKATHLIAQEFPDAFIPNSVGTTMVIGE